MSKRKKLTQEEQNALHTETAALLDRLDALGFKDAMFEGSTRRMSITYETLKALLNAAEGQTKG